MATWMYFVSHVSLKCLLKEHGVWGSFLAQCHLLKKKKKRKEKKRKERKKIRREMGVSNNWYAYFSCLLILVVCPVYQF